MKIFFGCSTAELFKYRKNYLSIRNFLIEEGHVLTRDWLPVTYKIAEEGRTVYNAEQVYSDVMNAINDADIVIIENTVAGFSTGHQITISIQRKKPLLVLWEQRKKRQFDRSFIEGIKSDYLQVSKYNLSNYDEIIRSFINKFSHASERHRFHLVIDEVERKYIDWAKFNKKISRTKVIRDAVRKQIDLDKGYGEYLRKTK